MPRIAIDADALLSRTGSKKSSQGTVVIVCCNLRGPHGRLHMQRSYGIQGAEERDEQNLVSALSSFKNDSARNRSLNMMETSGRWEHAGVKMLAYGMKKREGGRERRQREKAERKVGN